MIRFVFFLILLLSISTSIAQSNNWISTLKGDEAIVVNEGQFDRRGWSDSDQIEFGLKMGSIFTYFTKTGVTYRFEKFKKVYLKHDNESDNNSRRVLQSELINVEFMNANSNVTIESLDAVDYTFSYGMKTIDSTNSINNVDGFKRIKYINIYDNIDIEYFIHPVDGIKYNIILRPGANPNDIQLKYSTQSLNSEGTINIELNSEGNIYIQTDLGNIIEKAPKTFYSTSNAVIASNYSFVNNILQFQLENYDNNQTVIIDPWVISPNFNAGDFTREVETDAVGNIYTIGGELPMVLRKYTAAGALVWQYNTPWDTINGQWLGTLATNAAGVSFVTQGTGSEIERVNTGGGMDWHRSYSPGGLSTEFWSITFNCDDTKLIIGGTGSVGFLGFDARIYDIDQATGNVNGQSIVNSGMNGCCPNEVRSITSSKNAKYIFQIHTDIGAINQNIGACPTDVPVYKTANTGLAYKCENFLSIDQNGGGLKSLAANDNFIYVNNGDEVRKYDVSTGALITTVALPGGSAANAVFGGGRVVHCSGIDVDAVGNVYVGSMDRVVKFDQNLNVISSINTSGSFTVYDVSVSSNGEVIAGGALLNNGTASNRGSRIQSMNFSTPGKYALVCCDVNVCPAGPFCPTDAPFQLVTSTPGGIWSGTGVNASGMFDPSIGGAGNWTITYTLPCGSESILIVVNPCNLPVTVCKHPDGSLTATGGNGVYSWYTATASTTPINNQAECESCGEVWTCSFLGCWAGGSCSASDCISLTLTQYATGTNTSPPASYPIQVQDGLGAFVNYTLTADIIDCPSGLPVEFGEIKLNCLGRNTQIEWTTITELNNDYFVVEKRDENGVFQEVGRESGVGTSTSIQSYSLIDKTRNVGVAYYRVHQVDFDGKKSTGYIKSINCSDESIHIYPNPFNDEVNIELGEFMVSNQAFVQITNGLGQVVFTQYIQDDSSIVTINTNDFKQGFYLVMVTSNGKTFTEKMIKN